MCYYIGMSNFESRVNEVLSKSRQRQAEVEAETGPRAIAAAKPAALNVLVERAQEAANFLNTREIMPEMSKKVTVDIVQHSKWLSRKEVSVPITESVGMWGLMDPTKKKGVAIDAKGNLYTYKGDSAEALDTLEAILGPNEEVIQSAEELRFDKAVSVIGATHAYSVERVTKLGEFFDAKVVGMVARVLTNES